MRKLSSRKVVLAIADMFIIFVGSILTNAFLSMVGIDNLSDNVLLITSLLLSTLCIAFLLIAGAYSKLWRYFSIKDYLSCLIGMVAGNGVVSIILFIILSETEVQTPFLIANFIVTTLGIMIFRVIFRKTFLVLIDSNNDQYKKKTLIIGAGRAADIILKEIHQSRSDVDSPCFIYSPVGIIDDDNKLQNTTKRGVRVVGKTEDIVKVCQVLEIEIIIFAIPSCSEAQKRYILDFCSETSCEIKVIPYLGELLEEGKVSEITSKLDDIRVEDLLGREPIRFKGKRVRDFVHGKVCMITGGGGSIGSELSRQIAKYEPKLLIVLDIYENNAYDIQQELVMEYKEKLNIITLIASVREYDKMENIFKKYRPEIVFHAAAHKHVPLMETSPEEAVKNNIDGSLNTALLAKKYETEKFVMISTDKAVNPTNVMGASKRCCEMIMEYLSKDENCKTEFVTTRFGNVLGSNGSVIPLFKRQIESGKPLTVTHPEIIRYFMTIPEAVSLVLQAAEMAEGGEIFVLDMGAPVKIVNLAENLIRMYGKIPHKDVKIVYTGLRPGEKLYEELLMAEEGLSKTPNDKIFIGSQIPIDVDEFEIKLEKLRNFAKDNNSAETLQALKDIVPTFKHKDSNSA